MSQNEFAPVASTSRAASLTNETIQRQTTSTSSVPGDNATAMPAATSVVDTAQTTPTSTAATGLHPPPTPRAPPQLSTSSSSSTSPSALQHMGYTHTADLSTYLTTTFAPQVQPLAEEYMAKESARVFLEQLANRVSPGAKLLPFGSMANGFALKNSDMDLCCLLDKSQPLKPASELVELLGSLIEKETNFHVKMLPRARIPIIKLTMPPTSSVPFGMSCDIGFENRLALENTRLLRTYSLVDSRLRVLVLFLKVWTKRRKINNPYRGTLSSYGFVLLVIHYLAQVRKPAVLPNLQQLPLSRSVPLEELEVDGNDITFFDDLDNLSTVWQCSNNDNVGDLLIEFFRYFAKDFTYAQSVISIRSECGLLTKESKGWMHDTDYDPDMIVRDQYRLCIEIRGEFMRAFRLLTSRSSGHAGGHWATIINDVCEEREDYLMQHPPNDHRPSPRRRSAPSPRMMPHLAAGLPHPPPLVPPPFGFNNSNGAVQDFRYWTSSSVNGHQVQALDPRVFAREQSTATEGSAIDEGWDPASLVTPSSATFGSSTTASPNHLASASFASTSGSSYRGLRSPLQTGQPLSSTIQVGRQPRSKGSNVPQPLPLLERRSSWDGTGSTGSVASSSTYDLHRFFQNPSSSSSTNGDGVPSNVTPTSQVGVVSSTSSNQNHSTGPTGHVVEPRSAMTAPSSPDLLPQNYYSMGGFMHGPGPRAQHYNRFNGYPVGSRLGSLPNRVAQYGGGGGHGYHHRHHHHQQQQITWGPAPIFPEEDREAVALANSITFGTFPSPTALRGGYATFSPTNSGVPMPGLADPSSTTASSAIASPARSELSLGGGTTLEAEEQQQAETAGIRGRRLMNDTIVMPSTDDVGFGVNRQRGRSVPQVRLGPDGRESILFGEIKVTLPKAETEESAVSFDDENETQVDDSRQRGNLLSTNRNANSDANIMAAMSMPSSDGDASTSTTATSMLSPTTSGRNIPTLKTQPPTPLKQAPSFTSFSPMPTTPVPQSPTNFLPPFSSPMLAVGQLIDGTTTTMTTNDVNDLNEGGIDATRHTALFDNEDDDDQIVENRDDTTPVPLSTSFVGRDESIRSNAVTTMSSSTEGLQSPKLVPVPVTAPSSSSPWVTIATGSSNKSPTNGIARDISKLKLDHHHHQDNKSQI
ncbi:hypothetical protein OIO90_004365 [Microbotryomycetes sp. JL221]|nr:hypothetical protein OIO90_004365 [Microbotryomycetes sp. JL221]